MNDTPKNEFQDNSLRFLLAKAAREPLVHFVLGGTILFGVWFSFADHPTNEIADEMRIEITEGDMRQIGIVMLSQGRQLPNAEQMRELAKQEAIQRILVQEAISLGLDQHDEIIERRLAQKMDFLLTDLATLTEPDTEGLKTWYAAHKDLFALPPRASFRHLYFSQDERGLDNAKAAAASLLPTLEGVKPDDPGIKAKADRFMFRDYYGGRTPDEIAREFGPGFVEALFELEPGYWHGPVRSGYGWHLVWVDTIEPGGTALFETVEEDVRAAWLQERYSEIRDRAYEEMLSRYEIVIPDPASVDYTSATTASRAPSDMVADQ
ncbi:peptidyl-prolyl cis-trans isomerase [Roseibium sp. M-1]